MWNYSGQKSGRHCSKSLQDKWETHSCLEQNITVKVYNRTPKAWEKKWGIVYFGKLGIQKHLCTLENLERHMDAQGRMHSQKTSERTLNFHLWSLDSVQAVKKGWGSVVKSLTTCWSIEEEVRQRRVIYKDKKRQSLEFFVPYFDLFNIFTSWCSRKSVSKQQLNTS